MENVALVLGRLGWRLNVSDNIKLQAGIKLFLPISFSPPYFRYREKGGGLTATGESFGGDELSRIVTAYLEGSF